jgi:molybdopterin/thiamine biosynthesis adenylyltransferase
VLPVLPGRSACLQCLMPEPPDIAEEQARKASTVGVIAPVVAAVASYQAAAAMKLLTENQPDLHLLKLDVWRGTTQRIDVMGKQDPNCTLCGHKPL